MCHTLLQDPNFHALLLRIDEDQAAQTRAAGCPCGGVLHSARYPRKPRGGPRGLGESHRFRLSFCCAICRGRRTPVSVRFFGRRVYLAPVVVLASAMRHGLTGARVARLSEWLGVPKRTLERWRGWWLQEFVDTSFWKDARARFLPPLNPALLPAGLLERFAGAALGQRLVSTLRFLAPLSTLCEGR